MYLEGVLFLICSLSADAAVHVNDVEGFRSFDDQIGALFQRDYFPEGTLYLSGDFKMVKDALFAIVKLRYLLLPGRNDSDIIPDFLVCLLVVHVNVAE